MALLLVEDVAAGGSAEGSTVVAVEDVASEDVAAEGSTVAAVGSAEGSTVAVEDVAVEDVAAQGSTVAVEDVFEGSAVAVEDVAEGSTVAVEDVAKGSMFAADAVEHEGIVFEAPGPLELDELMAVVARERALGLWTPTGTPASFSWSEDETDGASDGDDGRP